MTESGYRTGPNDDERLHFISIPLYLVLTILTFFVFNIYWNYRQMEACNDLLDRDEFSFVVWLLLCLVTCGIYHFFYQYKMGAAINEIQEERDLPITDNLPVLSVVAAILGVGIVADCIHQFEINKIVS
jgi:hypothetical protein